MKALLKKVPLVSILLRMVNESKFMKIRRARQQYERCYFPLPSDMGSFGTNSFIEYPVFFDSPFMVHVEENVKIRSGARFINSPGEKILIRKYTVVGSDCMIITNNHRKTVGVPQFLLGTSHINDSKKDVVVAEDVWIGARVTILPNADIGRGSIVGAGSLVTHSVPPYSVVVGSPARIVGKVFELDDILRHESQLYSPQECMTRDELKELFEKYNYSNLKTYGSNSPLSDHDVEVIDDLKKAWNYIEPNL